MKAGPTGHPSSMIAKPENPSIRRDLYIEKLKYIFPYKSFFFFQSFAAFTNNRSAIGGFCSRSFSIVFFSVT